jgi:membrane protein
MENPKSLGIGNRKLNKLGRHLRIKERDGFSMYLAKSLILRFLKDDIGSSAAALSYYLLFSFFPFLIFVNLALAQFNISEWDVKNWGAMFLPKEVIDLTTIYLGHLSTMRSMTFLMMGLFVALYSITRAVNSLNIFINRAYRIDKTRPALAGYVLAGVLTVMLFSMFILNLILITLGGNVMNYISGIFSLPPFFIRLWSFIRWGAMAAIYLFTLSIFYYSMPYVKITFHSVLPGTVGAGLGLVAASYGFSFYVNYIASFSVIYGSLGAIIIFMLWLYITSTVMILGGELNHILLCYQKRKSRRQRIR